jgi:hypothetical protein|tara:strand:- start:1243 stop:1899 length:657 start_codon:yes stop_codon:yes gene_type:complete
MKQVPIKNIKLLQKLDSFATSLIQMPHTWVSEPKADLTFATLKGHMADASFVGYPTSHNYQDYSGTVAIVQNTGKMKKRLRSEKYFFLKYFQYGHQDHTGVSHPAWYYDTLTTMPPRWGFTGWSNSKNKGRCYLRFIYNGGSGYSIEVEGKRQTTVKDQKRNVGAGNWTCITGHMGKDGQTWFADCNTGSKPRVVIDLSIPEKYQHVVDAAVKHITEY